MGPLHRKPVKESRSFIIKSIKCPQGNRYNSICGEAAEKYGKKFGLYDADVIFDKKGANIQKKLQEQDKIQNIQNINYKLKNKIKNK